jgi:hypothetical protein
MIFLQIFDSIGNTVDSVMMGFNGTILAYGQTSSGSKRVRTNLTIGFDRKDTHHGRTLTLGYFDARGNSASDRQIISINL